MAGASDTRKAGSGHDREEWSIAIWSKLRADNEEITREPLPVGGSI
jgi:hypothetical protein